MVILLSLVPLSLSLVRDEKESINKHSRRPACSEPHQASLCAACFWDPLRRKRVGPKVFFLGTKEE